MCERKSARRGAMGERLAAVYYRRRGCRVLEMNFRTRRGEIDVIAQKGDMLIFAEVKTRGGTKKTLAAVQQALAELKAPKEKPPKDADKLRLELHRLGMLDDEQRQYELAQRFSEKSDLKRLAEAAGLPLPKEAKKGTIIAAILAAAKRVAGHTLSP